MLSLGCFKETVSPYFVLDFSLWKIKLVLSVGPLMVLTFFYFKVPKIFKIDTLKLLLWKHLLIVQTLLKAVAKSMFRLTERIFTFITGLLKPGISSLYPVSVRFCIISKRFHRSSFKIYVYWSKGLQNKQIYKS